MAALDGLAKIIGGVEEYKMSKYEAAQLEQQANVDRAASQRAAEEERRRARHLYSKALARAAASGGGVSNPTVTKILGEIDAEGEYRALARKFQGEHVARGREMQANARRREGRVAAVTGSMRGVSSIASSSMWSK